MRPIVSLLLVLLAVVACGGEGVATPATLAARQATGSTVNGCPDAVEDGGLVEGMDLDAPDWLPVGFPLPGDLSLRHLNGNYLGEQNILTGFVPGGDNEEVLTALGGDLIDAGYEQLLAAEGFVPVAFEALIVMNERREILATVGVVQQEAPVRVSEEECPWMPGVLLSIRFEPTDVDKSRLLYSGSSLTEGAAQATVGSREFASLGECLVQGATYTYSSTSGDLIGLQIDESASGPVGFASVNAIAGDGVFNLDLAERSDTEPSFRVLESGFSVEGMFIDGLGDEGLVAGRVVVNCG